MTFRTVTSDRLRRLLEERLPPRLVDVRTAGEYEQFHLPSSINIPLGELEERAREIDPMVDHVLVSEHGIRSLHACQWLAARGYLRVINLIGGVCEFRFHHG
jgi:rhodanese-related sulfurtransferase